ncbi:MAG: M48 family metallopeptidase [Verrucomicrobiota bacterium]
MDFFSRQDQAIKNSKTLVIYFILAIVTTVIAFYFAIVFLIIAVSEFFTNVPFIATEKSEPSEALFGTSVSYYDDLVWGGSYWLFDPELFLITSLITGIIICMGTCFKMHQVSKGGGYVATLLGGRLVNPGTDVFEEKKLINVVEEMAIASGMAVPEVYVLDEEMGINAFAAGFEANDSVIGVTQGCIKGLNRDELQGVIAHEFSHILNGDMAMNMRLVSMTYGISCLSTIGRVILELFPSGGRRHRYGYGDVSSNKRGNAGGFIIFILGIGFSLYVIGGIGHFFARLIQSAVSRQREFLADASAVQFTRNKEGIVGAFLKILGYSKGSKMSNAFAGEVSHFFFGNGISSSLNEWFSTHPPLMRRIKEIDPNFEGVIAEFKLEPADKEPAVDEKSKIKEGMKFLSDSSVAGLVDTVDSNKSKDSWQKSAEQEAQNIYYAQAIRKEIPKAIYDAAHEPFGARALVYGLLLDPEDDIRAHQVKVLEQHADKAVMRELNRLWEALCELPASNKIPVLDISISALRFLSPDQYKTFKDNVRALIESDGQISLFEYMLEKMLIRHLDKFFSKKKKPNIKYQNFLSVMDPILIVLSSFAYLGQDDPDKIKQAFHKGCQQLNITNYSFKLIGQEKCGLQEVDHALNELAQAKVFIKRNVIYASSKILVVDQEVNAREAELIRATADVLNCPIPPFIEKSKNSFS